MSFLPEMRRGAPGLKLPSAPRMVPPSAYTAAALRGSGRSRPGSGAAAVDVVGGVDAVALGLGRQADVVAGELVDPLGRRQGRELAAGVDVPRRRDRLDPSGAADVGADAVGLPGHRVDA